MYHKFNEEIDLKTCSVQEGRENEIDVQIIELESLKENFFLFILSKMNTIIFNQIIYQPRKRLIIQIKTMNFELWGKVRLQKVSELFIGRKI